MIRAPLEIYANRSGMGLAKKICDEISKLRANDPDNHESCDIQLNEAQVRPRLDIFACGEFKVNLEDSVRGKDVFLVQCAIDRADTSRSIHDNLWETLQTIEALRGCHAQYVTLIMPCLPYSRQDKTDGRESYGSVVLAKEIAAVGADQLITYDIHAQQIKGFYRILGVQPDALFATNIFLEKIRSSYSLENLVVVAPDAGAAKRAEYYSRNLFGEDNVDETKLVYSIKTRSKKSANKVDSLRFLGNVAGKTVLVADDLIDTAGTMEAFIDTATLQGAKGVVACATHPVLSNPASKRFDRLYAEGKLMEVLTTDTVPQPADYAAKHPWFKCYSVAPMLADIIDKINKEEKTSPLYL